MCGDLQNKTHANILFWWNKFQLFICINLYISINFIKHPFKDEIRLQKSKMGSIK